MLGKRGLRMLFWVQHTAPQRATVLGLLLGPPAGPLYKLLASAKGELPPAGRPAVQGPHRPASSFPLLPQTLPPASRHKCALGGSRQGNLSFRTAQRGSGGVLADLFIAKHPVRMLSSAACLPLGLFNPCLYLSPKAVGIMARPEIALKTFT